MPHHENITGYYGRILNGRYSEQLKNRVENCINSFAAFDKIGGPAIPYISAWQEKQNIIWYEFVSRRLTNLLGCEAHSAASSFRNKIIERHVYSSKAFDRGIRQEVINQSDMQVKRSKLRDEAKKSGTVEAVYKIFIKGRGALWLKDQAIIESFEKDGISVSFGNLTIVTKEMEAEEALKRIRNDLRKSEKKFRDQAIHDSLTGLFNTRYLYKTLPELINKSASSNQQFSLIFMDIDNFKEVVDTHGHLNASRALQEIAVTINNELRDPSYGVAYGGDEFVLVLPNFNKKDGLEMAEKIRTCIKESIYLQEKNLQVRVSASLGVSTYPDDADTFTELLALADQAMFSVKERGKDAICGSLVKTWKEKGAV